MPTRDLSTFGPVEPGVGDGLVGAVDADAAGPGAAADVFLLLVPQLVEVADAGQRLADVADFVGLDAAAAGQQAVAELGQRVAVGRGQADAGDDDPLVVGPAGTIVRIIRRPNAVNLEVNGSQADWQAAESDQAPIASDRLQGRAVASTASRQEPCRTASSRSRHDVHGLPASLRSQRRLPAARIPSAVETCGA